MSLDLLIETDSSIANALRRTMIGDVPSVAIDTVCIKENDSKVFSDEFIAHRLGQIPLRVDPEFKETVFKCKLQAKGPCNIYSRDIVFNSEYIKPVSPDILIMRLGSNEIIDLTGQTEEGTGKDHAKWSVCCGTSYKKLDDNKFQFHIETTGSKTPEETLHESIEILKNELVKYKKLL